MTDFLWTQCPPSENDDRLFWYWDGKTETPCLTTQKDRQHENLFGWWKPISSPRLPRVSMLHTPSTRWIRCDELNRELLQDALGSAIQYLYEEGHLDHSLWICRRTLLVKASELYPPFTRALSKSLALEDDSSQLAFELANELRKHQLAKLAQPFLAGSPTYGCHGLQPLLEIDLDLIWPETITRPVPSSQLEDLGESIMDWYRRQGDSIEPIPVRLAVIGSAPPMPLEPADQVRPSVPGPILLTIDREAPSFLLLPASSHNAE
ncbi:hypothetical protein SAMN04244547_03882 [Azotobacter vinelandii]|nr:hypothetical protein SAMN04244547_03882 [Azotobacter vinelandii]